ncbi:unnamed protein product, partial [Didymodactylos carnosus]
MPAMWARS